MITTPQYLHPLSAVHSTAAQGPRRSRRSPKSTLLRSTRQGQPRGMAKPNRQAASSVTRCTHQLNAIWTNEQAECELVVVAHATGLQLKFCTWLIAGPALEQSFVVHTLADFEQWMTTAPTKFGHPVAHEEIRRFAHASLTR